MNTIYKGTIVMPNPANWGLHFLVIGGVSSEGNDIRYFEKFGTVSTFHIIPICKILIFLNERNREATFKSTTAILPAARLKEFFVGNFY